MAGHVALRSCIVCRRKAKKDELFRFVADGEGFLSYDAGGDRPGRGFYFCRRGNCLAEYVRKPGRHSTKFHLREIVPESRKQLGV